MNAYLRRATEKDSELLYQWANDDAVRVNSFSTAKINYEEHRKWYQELLADNKRQQYIYIYDNESIGQIRLAINGKSAEVGYSIQADRRCMGHGKIMLQLLVRQVKEDYPDVEQLIAKVKPDNAASQKVFLETRFVEQYRCYVLETAAYLED